MRLMFVVGLGAFALSSVACSQATALSDSDVAAIKTVTDTYVKTALAGDWDAWGKTIAEDAVTLPPNSAPLKGRAAAVAFGKAFPKMTSFSVSTTETTGRGDIAYIVGTFSLAAKVPDGSSLDDKGSFIDVLQRQSDGGWLFSRLTWHSDIPMADPAAAGQELIALEKSLGDATIKKDRGPFDRAYGADYEYRHSNGSVLNKDQDIEELASGDQKWTAVKFDDMKARVYGDVGIVTGTETLIGSAKGYVPGPRHLHDVFVRRNGAWQQVGGQSMVPTKK